MTVFTRFGEKLEPKRIQLPAGWWSHIDDGFEPTGEQADALEKLGRWLCSGLEDEMVLAGSAGTGKTTVVARFANALVYLGHRVALCAPTNKATKVLREKVDGVDCFTIHSGAGLRIADDAETKYTVKQGKGKLEGYDLIIIDEASMIGERLHDNVEATLRDSIPRPKVLYVGDPLQLLPVRDGHHIVFTLQNQTRLTKVVRQAEENPIIQFAQTLRDAIESGRGMSRLFPETLDENGCGVRYLRAGEFADAYLEACQRMEIDGDYEARAIAWRNSVVDAMAQDARRHVQGEAALERPYIVGDRVYTKQPLTHGMLGMHTDEEATVVEVGEPCPHPLWDDIECWPVVLTPEEGGRLVAYAVHERSQSLLDQALSSLKAKALNTKGRAGNVWREYHQLRDSFANLSPIYAITAHRAQGSTYDDVFVRMDDLASCRNRDERYRLLYVAATRARNNVFLLK